MMDIFDAIKNRRSIGKVKPDPVDSSLIEKLLEAAAWAPNHFRTEPWKFFVLTGEGRRILGRAYAEIAKEQLDNPETEENRSFLNKQEAKAFRAPVVIAVAVTPSDNHPLVPEIEEIGAVHAAIQNMLLAAHALSLGAIWRTGQPIYHAKMKDAFGLKEHDRILGLIYIGYPDIEQPVSVRVDPLKKTVWIDS